MSTPSSASQCAASETHSCRATNRFKTTTSRVVRSATSWASGRTDRIRATASRTEATLLARSVLSTIARSQHAARAELLDRTKVQILENGFGAAGLERHRVASEDRTAIAERTVRKTRRRLVEKHEIDAPAGGCLEPGRQRSQLHRVQLMRASHADRHIHIAVRVHLPRDARSEDQRVRDARVGLEDGAQLFDHRAVPAIKCTATGYGS